MLEDDVQRDGEEAPVRVVDRRRFHETPDGDIEKNTAAEEARDRRPTYVRELEERLAASEERLQQTLEAHRERLQEFDQIRARLDRDFGVRVEEAKAQMFRRILDVVGEMELALAAAEQDGDAPENPLTEGLRLIHRKLFATLQEEGVVKMELQGEPFDPEVAEAIGVVAVDDPAQHDRVTLVAQAGYRIGERILRPAQVQVGRHEAPEEESV
ncbi:MAG: nucleotide exchange factor GrpE [Acidobacteria bacterium]|nr:MAG: nucleotide exchange factor GrpE [Acidobacteriota bacterium]